MRCGNFGSRTRCQLVTVAALTAVACGGSEPPAPQTASATPVYNQDTGRLEQIVSDRDGDGIVETRAFMDGTRVVRIEIDRNGDGRPDRWEFYQSPPGDPFGSVIATAEEAHAGDDRITRRESYAAGVLQTVEEDTDLDGRMDKWETYREGRLIRVDLDLAGAGRPTRRMVYGPDGRLERLEGDDDGDGVFGPLPDSGGQR